MERNDLPRFLTVPEAARRLGIGRDQLRAAIARGELRAVVLRPGGWPRVEQREIERWANHLQRCAGRSRVLVH